MYFKKNRSLLRSIRNNNNNKAYFALIVVMLAAISIIAASIIYNNHNQENDIVNETTSVYTEVTTTAVGTDDITPIPSSLEYVICIMLDEGLVSVYRQDNENNIKDISIAAHCLVGSNIENYLKDKRSICLSDLYIVPSKSVWEELTYNNEAYYVQYYSMMNGIEFHSALYSENGNTNSVIADIYNAIDNSDIEIIPPDGITLTVKTSKWIYENVPGTTDIYICRSYADSPLFVDKSDNIDWTMLLASSPDGAYMDSGRLFSIPSGFHTEPTDDESDNVYCPYRIGSINNVKNKTVEFGQIAYSFIDENSTLPKIIFGDTVLLTEDGADVSEYLICTADVSQYVYNQIVAMDVNGFLIPGDYTVVFSAADRYGNTLYERCWLHIVDTTAPVISLTSEITEITQTQLNDSEYIHSMVTVKELCKLTNDEPDFYIVEEGDYVIIHFTASDIYGNTGELDVKLQIIE